MTAVTIEPHKEGGNPEVSRTISPEDVLKAYLHTMSVRAPLLWVDHGFTQRSTFMATIIPIVLLKRTEAITISTIKDRTERMIAKGVGSQETHVN